MQFSSHVVVTAIRFDFDSTGVKSEFEYLSKFSKCTTSRSHADLFIYLGCSAAARAHRCIGVSTVVT